MSNRIAYAKSGRVPRSLRAVVAVTVAVILLAALLVALTTALPDPLAMAYTLQWAE